MALKTSLAAGLIALTATTLSACVTQPQPCTQEWIEWKTDRVLTRFARDNSDTVRALRRVSGEVESPSALMAIQLITLADDFTELARSFDRIVLPELNAAVAQCGEPRNFMPAFTQFLRREDVGEDVIAWIEALGYIALDQRRP